MRIQAQFNEANSGARWFTGNLTIMAAIIVIACAGSTPTFAQSLNWEGQTGVFVTPLAYSVSTGNATLSIPVVSYHHLNAGRVLGGFHQVSITMGAFNRVEFGYTGSLHQDGSTPGLSTLWSAGFNTLLPERSFVEGV